MRCGEIGWGEIGWNKRIFQRWNGIELGWVMWKEMESDVLRCIEMEFIEIRLNELKWNGRIGFSEMDWDGIW